jgi:hypothetical protein
LTTYYADFDRDIISKNNPKRIVLYAKGLKIYGVLPYILARKLKAEFFSNNLGVLGAKLIAPTQEDNYTIVPYAQSPASSQKLLDWLYSDAGFLWAIASSEYWDEEIAKPNICNKFPEVWLPYENQEKQTFLAVFSANNSDAAKLLLSTNASMGGYAKLLE